MKFAIEYFVGASRGSWVVSSERFKTQHDAARSAHEQEMDEMEADVTPMMRRPVEVG